MQRANDADDRSSFETKTEPCTYQNFKMLLAICEKNWQFLHQLATILSPEGGCDVASWMS